MYRRSERGLHGVLHTPRQLYAVRGRKYVHQVRRRSIPERDSVSWYVSSRARVLSLCCCFVPFLRRVVDLEPRSVN